MSENTAPEPANKSLRRGILLGLASGLVAITCCVSPVVLVLLGVADCCRGGDAWGHTLLHVRLVLFGQPDSV